LRKLFPKHLLAMWHVHILEFNATMESVCAEIEAQRKATFHALTFPIMHSWRNYFGNWSRIGIINILRETMRNKPTWEILEAYCRSDMDRI